MRQPKKILIMNAHPRAGSLSDALAASYEAGAKAAGHEIRSVALRELQFDLVLREKKMPLEPDLVKIQDAMKWCQHLVIVSPMWWFGTPALLKGFFDRVLTPGFAYKHTRHWPRILPKRLMSGRSARVIYTHDGFRILISGLLGDPFWRAIKWGTLWYCGFSPVRRTIGARVFHSHLNKRRRWLAHVYRLGYKGR